MSMAVLSVLALIFLLGEMSAVSEADQETEADSPQSDKVLSGPEARMLKQQVREMIGSFQAGQCGKKGLVSYHGKCMEAEEKSALFELEIRHVEILLNQTREIYKATAPESVALAFHEAEEFVSRFEADRIIDDRMAEKLLLLLGFLYTPVDTLAKQMREELEDPEAPEDILVFLDRRERMNSFLEEVHIPLMRLLGKRIDAYIARHGKEKFDRLMADNSLADILKHLE